MRVSRFNLLASVLWCALFSTLSFADADIQIVGQKQQPLSQVVRSVRASSYAQLPAVVTLLNMHLSQNAWSKLTARAENPINPNASFTTPQFNQKSVQLGMNQVPVLDQGQHGSCAVFANVGALDAALNQGDYISQLCVLQLGSYLEKNGYGMSGWDGSLGPLVLHQIQAYGVVNKQTEQTHGCGGLTEYPANTSSVPDTYISLADYHGLSEPLLESNIAWSSILDAYQVFMDNANPELALKQVKDALMAGDRLTFGVLLFNINQGVAGAVGKNRAVNDSWVLTPDTIQSIKNRGEFGGHEMIITGFDDDAVAFDAEGRKYKGLLTLRNSWGSAIGDQGEFYMSYDYFKTLVIEIQRIRHIN